jgi:hypothetical protein
MDTRRDMSPLMWSLYALFAKNANRFLFSDVLIIESINVDEKMSNEYGPLSGWELARKIETLGENLPQCHCVQHKSHMTWRGIKPGPPLWELSTNHQNSDTALTQNKSEVTSCHRKCLPFHFCLFIILNNIINIYSVHITGAFVRKN